MKLRTKTIITITIISSLIFVILQAITFFVIDPSFSNLETQESKHNLNQALNVINYNLTNLQGQLKDYSHWNDTYNYVQNKNQEYIENNFVESTFDNLNLNLICIVNNNRNIVYCQSFDLNNLTKVQTSEGTRRILTSDDNI
jgi:sensor domain CHASE-containing protein